MFFVDFLENIVMNGKVLVYKYVKMTTITIEKDIILDKSKFDTLEKMFLYFMRNKVFSPTEIWYLYSEDIDKNVYNEYLDRKNGKTEDFIDVTNE